MLFFGKGDKSNLVKKWTYNGKQIEVVNDLNYLGVVLNSTGSFVLITQYIVGKGLKAMSILINKDNKFKLKPARFSPII